MLAGIFAKLTQIFWILLNYPPKVCLFLEYCTDLPQAIVAQDAQAIAKISLGISKLMDPS